MKKQKPLTFNSSPMSYEELKTACKKKNWYFKDYLYKQGSDYVTFQYKYKNFKVTVVYNTVNGKFIIELKNGEMITERSTFMDTIPWYKGLLKFIYGF